MNEEMYREFLVWLRHQDSVTARLEAGTLLVDGVRAQSEPERQKQASEPWDWPDSERVAVAYSLGTLRRDFGDESVDAFLAYWDEHRGEICLAALFRRHLKRDFLVSNAACSATASMMADD